jgi:hypothetical protein
MKDGGRGEANWLRGEILAALSPLLLRGGPAVRREELAARLGSMAPLDALFGSTEEIFPAFQRHQQALLARTSYALACATEPLPRIHAPSEREIADCFSALRPAILTGVIEDRPCRRWTLDTLAADYGELRAVWLALDGPHTSVWTMSGARTEPITLGEAMPRLRAGHGRLLVDLAPEQVATDPLRQRLCAELGAPPAHIGPIASRNVFFTSSHISFGVHNDTGSDQLLLQLIGRKAVMLARHTLGNARGLYPHRAKIHRSTLLDVEAVNPDRYPRFSEVRAGVGVLEPGDILYIPNSSWHDARPLGVALSINFRSQPNRVGPILNRLASQLCGADLPFSLDQD